MKTEIIIQTSWQNDSVWSSLSAWLIFCSCPAPPLFTNYSSQHLPFMLGIDLRYFRSIPDPRAQHGQSGIKRSPLPNSWTEQVKKQEGLTRVGHNPRGWEYFSGMKWVSKAHLKLRAASASLVAEALEKHVRTPPPAAHPWELSSGSAQGLRLRSLGRAMPRTAVAAPARPPAPPADPPLPSCAEAPPPPGPSSASTAQGSSTAGGTMEAAREPTPTGGSAKLRSCRSLCHAPDPPGADGRRKREAAAPPPGPPRPPQEAGKQLGPLGKGEQEPLGPRLERSGGTSALCRGKKRVLSKREAVREQGARSLPPTGAN